MVPVRSIIANAAFKAVLGEAVEMVLISLVGFQKDILDAQHKHVLDGLQSALNVGIELPPAQFTPMNLMLEPLPFAEKRRQPWPVFRKQTASCCEHSMNRGSCIAAKDL